MKYRDNMTDAEKLAFMSEIDALSAAYADADKFYPLPPDDEWEDEMETLRRAALDHRGRP